MTENPDKVLLEKILKRIENSGLITEKVLGRYRNSIVEGTMATEDWSVLTESVDNDIENKNA